MRAPERKQYKRAIGIVVEALRVGRYGETDFAGSYRIRSDGPLATFDIGESGWEESESDVSL